MRDNTSIWSRYVTRLFGTTSANERRGPGKIRSRRANQSPCVAAELLEERALLSGETFPLTSIPVLHSNPGAAATLYLDFNGHVDPQRTTPVYDADGDATTFSAEELAFIQDLWQVVAEDYAPFNIDVTTVEPAELAPGVPDSQANGVALRIAIGGNNPSGATGGGLAQFNSFTNSASNVGWAYAQGQTDPVAYGQVTSHEAAHCFGLVHQSEHGNFSSGWTPIMYGASASNSSGTFFATWHNGLNTSGVAQDDMAVIASATNGFGYRSDDHGNTTAAATPLTQSGNTWSGAGIVGTNTDVDMWSFTVTTDDTYRITAGGLPGPGANNVSSNLDAALELRNSAGTLIGSANPLDSRSAEVRAGLTPGTYFVAVQSNGVYGRIGQYALAIDTPPAGITVTPVSDALTTGEDGRQTSFTVALQTQPTADVTIAISSTNTAEGTVSAASLVFTAANWDIPQTVTLTGVDDGFIGNDVAYNVIIGAAVTADAEYSGLDPADMAVVNLDNDAAGFIYYVDSSADTINRSRLNGSQPETLVDLKALFGASGSYTPNDIAVDLAGGKMYWTDTTQKSIRRANLDGSNVETVVSFPTADLRGISLDVAAGKMYWIDNGTDKIQRANLNGSGIEDLVTDVVLFASGMALDIAAGKMYWTEGNLIRRANLNGTNSEVVWTAVEGGDLRGIALDVGAGKLYWSDAGQDLIQRANLDGTNVEVVVSTPSLSIGSTITRLALDVPAGKLYWTNSLTDTIYRANLDGSTVAGLGSGPGLGALAIAHPGPQISVTPGSGLVTTEDGASAVFRVSLTTQPTANVTIALSNGDPTEGTLSTSSLTFTPANWNVTQTVTVTGVADSLLDGDIAYTITLAPAVSSDPVYSGFNPADVSVVNRDKAVNQTKFYVVDDASQNKTYEYNASGGLVESYNVNSGNSAPRGAASAIAGDKVWVVDANRKVYVYNRSGGLLGSWTAGTLASNATVEGIAVSPNGADVWIVDAKSDKVFYYAGAGSRLSGSQNATSSFSLLLGYSSPKDITTNGVHLWVVNDSTTDHVVKYTVAGSYVGLWTIDPANSKPTGLTIDPANVSNIWIVDSGTDRIYQYNGAATRTSGSQTAAATYALASGNGNPQGIADPPAGLGDPLAPTSGPSIGGFGTFGESHPSRVDLDSLFTALAANFDLSGNDDEWSASTRAGAARSRGRTRLNQRV